MIVYDRLFRPVVTRLQLLEGLREAVRAVHPHGGALPHDAEDWERVVGEARHEAEGRIDVPDGARPGAPRVRIAWWTDADQRRHFRVRGETTEPPTGLAIWEPLRDVYPDRVF